MRRAGLLLACLLASACSPEVVAGAYFCGPERLCPEDLVCDGATNICVSSSDVQEFSCVGTDDDEPNDIDSTVDLGDLSCTTRVETAGCIGGDGDEEDGYRLDVPTDCAPRKVTVQLLYPVAFEPLELELIDTSGAADSVEPCPLGVDENGQTEQCVEAAVPAGGSFVVRVAGTGSENCEGECAYNRYGLVVLLSPQ
jgi:hypothetical protein